MAIRARLTGVMLPVIVAEFGLSNALSGEEVDGVGNTPPRTIGWLARHTNSGARSIEREWIIRGMGSSSSSLLALKTNQYLC